MTSASLNIKVSGSNRALPLQLVGAIEVRPLK